MMCPHCGQEIEQQPTGNLLNPVNANGANPLHLNLVYNNAACANPFPVQALTLNHMALNNWNGCNPIPVVNYIRF